MKREFLPSEDDDKNNLTEEQLAKRTEEVNVSIPQQMIETLLKNAYVYAKEPIVNAIDAPGATASCKVADETLTRLRKVYPIQKSVWPHILNKRSVVLVGNTDYYPHLVYLPPICDMIKVILSTQNKLELIQSWVLILCVFNHFQTTLDAQEDKSVGSDDLGGPKVIILEQKRQTMEAICRLGALYLGAIPPSSLVHFNDSYESNGLDVSVRLPYSLKIIFNKKFLIFHGLPKAKECAACEIFLTKPQYFCTVADSQALFPKTVERIVINNFEMILHKQRQGLVKMLYSSKLPVISFFVMYFPIILFTIRIDLKF